MKEYSPRPGAKTYEVVIHPEKVEVVREGVLFLGDQSPWSGGYLRARVASELGVTKVTSYFAQDVDTPWYQNGQSDIGLVHGWTKYWALAARYPFSLEIPGTRVDSARQSLGSPKGLTYMVGPKTCTTIGSMVENFKVGNLVREMLVAEARWATVVAETIGDREAIKRGGEIEAMLLTAPSLREQIALTAAFSGVHEVGSIIDYFVANPPQMVDSVGTRYYWVIAEDRTRREHAGQVGNGEVLVPKGKALPLEIAARGEVLGFTSLPYLPEIVNLRDRVLPEVRIRTLQISFDWRLREDPIEALWKRFEEKKKQRGQTVEKPEQDLKRICEYWRGRPTTISHAILGGELNPSLVYSEV